MQVQTPGFPSQDFSVVLESEYGNQEEEGRGGGIIAGPSFKYCLSQEVGLLLAVAHTSCSAQQFTLSRGTN